MEANVTELWQIVESLQLELALLRANITLTGVDVLVTASQVDSMGTDIDSLWLMLGSILVVFMQAGFAMLEVGEVSAKHTKDILIKNLLDLAVAAMVWWSFGWGIAYGGQTETGEFNQFFGPGSFFTRGEGFADEAGNYGTTEGYNWALWLFQMSFSGTAVTIVSGAVGTRISMPGYVVFAQVMGGFIYPVVVRWGWNRFGWASPWSDSRDDLLFGCGAIDFAGTGVIHATGGMAALVMVILTGPFLDQISHSDSSRSKREEGVITQTLGAFILWVGWYGFNGCSTLLITGSSHVAAKAMVCTTISAAAAGLGATSASLVLYQHVGPPELINGLLSGLVAITGCCAVVEVEAAFFIGLVSAINYLAFSRFLELVHIDDMVDASPVHLANGVWGMIAAGLFTSEEGYHAAYHDDRAQQCCGWLYGCGTAQLMANVCFLVSLLGWTGFTTLLLGYFLRRVGVLRISKIEERSGTDTATLKGTEKPHFARKILTRIETVAAKIGYNDDLLEDTASPPTTISRRAIVSSTSPSRRATKQTGTELVAPGGSETQKLADNVRSQAEDLAESVVSDEKTEDNSSVGSYANSCAANPSGGYSTSLARKQTRTVNVAPRVSEAQNFADNVRPHTEVLAGSVVFRKKLQDNSSLENNASSRVTDPSGGNSPKGLTASQLGTPVAPCSLGSSATDRKLLPPVRAPSTRLGFDHNTEGMIISPIMPAHATNAFVTTPSSNVAGVPETSDFRPSQANASGTNKEGNESLKAA